MSDLNPLSSSEIGTLWLTYQEKTMILRMLEYFIEKSDDQRATKIMNHLWKELHPFVEDIQIIFKKEGIAIPLGFSEGDVDLEAPK